MPGLLPPDLTKEDVAKYFETTRQPDQTFDHQNDANLNFGVPESLQIVRDDVAKTGS